jgi:hypothetical protein
VNHLYLLCSCFYREVNFVYGCICMHVCVVHATMHGNTGVIIGCLHASSLGVWCGPWGQSPGLQPYFFSIDAVVVHGIAALQQSMSSQSVFLPYWNIAPRPWTGLSKRNSSTSIVGGRPARSRVRVYVHRYAWRLLCGALVLERHIRPANNPRKQCCRHQT